MNSKMAIAINRRSETIRMWKQLAQVVEDKEIIFLLEEYPEFVDEIIADFEREYQKEIEIIESSINRYSWPFTKNNQPTRPIETAFIYLIAYKETEDFSFSKDFLRKLESFPKLEEYMASGFIENLSAEEIAELFKRY